MATVGIEIYFNWKKSFRIFLQNSIRGIIFMDKYYIINTTKFACHRKHDK